MAYVVRMGEDPMQKRIMKQQGKNSNTQTNIGGYDQEYCTKKRTKDSKSKKDKYKWTENPTTNRIRDKKTPFYLFSRAY